METKTFINMPNNLRRLEVLSLIHLLHRPYQLAVATDRCCYNFSKNVERWNRFHTWYAPPVRYPRHCPPLSILVLIDWPLFVLIDWPRWSDA